MRKFLFIVISFLSFIYADEYNLTLVYKDNINGNYKFIGNTVLEVNKNINYPAIYLNGKDNRVVIYDDGNHIIAKDKYNNICVFPKTDKNGKKVDISKKQKEYNFYNKNYIHFYDNYYKVTVKCNSKEFSVKKKNKKAQWTKFKNGCLEGHTYNNNFCYSKYIDIDNNSSTFDSSSSDLTLPNGSKIVYAGLYWSGLIDKNEKKLDKAKHVLLKINDGNYIPLYTNNNNSKNDNNDSFYYTTQASGYVYTAFKNITDKFKEYNDTLKKITVANVMSEKGINVNIGNFGAWALVVVYKNSKGHLKNIVIYNSFLKFYKNNKIIHVKDILTPINGKVYSKLSYFTVEGDIKSPEYREKANKDFTDKVEIKTNKTDDYINVSPNENNVSAPNYYLDIMDSSITTKENRTPEIENNMGIDIDTFDVGKDGNNSHKQILDNNITSVDIKITTGKDTFFLNSVVFATDLYQPRVCYLYDKIIDSDTNEVVYENGKFKKSIYQDHHYKVELIISNRKENNDTNDIDTAKLLKIITKYNDFNYTSESTFIDNDLNDQKDNFQHITDKKGDDIGEYLSDKNESIWRIGKGANASQGGTLEPYKNVYVDFNGSFVFNEKNLSQINLDDYIIYYATFKLASSNIEIKKPLQIPKCTPFNTTTGVVYLSGLFDAWDDNKDINDRHITTKLVNKQFTLKIASLNSSNNGLETVYHKFAKYALWDMINDTNITDWDNFDASKYSEVEKNYTIQKAYKNVKVMFKFCSKKINGNYYYYPYEDCVKNGTEVNCADENDTSICIRKRVSSDAFAIRPDKFIILNIPTQIKAGEDFNLTVKATQFNSNSPALNYNEILKINNTSSPTLEYNETKNGCLTGTLSSNPSNIRFINGSVTGVFNYNEVGDINLTIKEINGSEFAAIDKNDTSWNIRQIKPVNITLNIIPHHFDLVSTNYQNYKGKNFTYISKDLDMHSTLSLSIKAETSNNIVTKNYNKNCYAKNIDINITHSIPNNDLNLIYEINGTEYNISNNQNIIANNITKNYFNNGVANIPVYINFERKPNNPENEFNFTIINIKVKDVNDVEGNLTLNQNANFRYGFLKVKNLITYDTKDINTTFKYYYYTSNGWIINNDHNSSDFGDINKSKIIKPNDIYININQKNGKNINEGKESVNISTTHALPYSAKIHLAIPSWLWYHPLAKPYKDPSNSNEDCLTHPCIKVTFLKSGSGWAGVGRENSKYNENNKTVEVNLSKEINGTKNEVKKLNW